jgi:hypothetical protein
MKELKQVAMNTQKLMDCIEESKKRGKKVISIAFVEKCLFTKDKPKNSYLDEWIDRLQAR